METLNKESLGKSCRDAKGRFVKGAPGRPPNLKNKATRVKLAFLDVFMRLGGTEGLDEWVRSSKHNLREFYKMVLTILPKELTLDGNVGPENKIVVIYPEKKKEEPHTTHAESVPSRLPK